MISSARSLVFLTWAAASTAFAQTPPPPLRMLDYYYPKSGQMANLQTLQKEYASVLKNAGWDKPRMVFRSMAGPQRLAVLRGYNSHTEMPNSSNFPAKLKDVQSQVATMTLRMGEAAEKVERYIDNVLPDMSTGTPAEPPRYYRTTTVQVRPEKADEYIALLKNELIPALKRAGVKVYSVTRREFGGSRYQFRTSMSLNSLADLDAEGAAARAMGAEGYQRYVAKIRTMITDLEYGLVEYLPELSYVPGK